MVEVGVDEAGRGCAFGRIYAAAVILRPSILKTKKAEKLLKDSKKFTGVKQHEKRREAAQYIISEAAIDYAVGWCSSKEIDEVGLGICNIWAMHRALEGIKLKFNMVVVDGNTFFPYKDIPYKTIVGGDASQKSIAAASILAKVSRDMWISRMVDSYPSLHIYGLDSHKGYLTAKHREVCKKHGPSYWHRCSYTTFATKKGSKLILKYKRDPSCTPKENEVGCVVSSSACKCPTKIVKTTKSTKVKSVF